MKREKEDIILLTCNKWRCGGTQEPRRKWSTNVDEFEPLMNDDMDKNQKLGVESSSANLKRSSRSEDGHVAHCA